MNPASLIPSFPRKRESRDFSHLPLGPRFRGGDDVRGLRDWITASEAGVQGNRCGLCGPWIPGFRGNDDRKPSAFKDRLFVSNGWILILMAALFLGLGYIGVPVAFSLTAGVLVATMLTPISLPSIIGQLFNGVDSEALLAVPFFLLVGELMTRRSTSSSACRPNACTI